MTLKEINFEKVIQFDLKNANNYTYQEYTENQHQHPNVRGYCTLCEEKKCNFSKEKKTARDIPMKLGCISHGALGSDFLIKYGESGDGWKDTPVMFVFENPSTNYYSQKNNRCCCKRADIFPYPKWPTVKWWTLDSGMTESSIPGTQLNYEEIIWRACKEFKLKNFYTTNLIKCSLCNGELKTEWKDPIWGQFSDYNPVCIETCYNHVFKEELAAFKPKIIFTFRPTVYSYLVNKKMNGASDDQELLRDTEIVMLPYPTRKMLYSSYRFMLNYTMINAALYSSGVLTEKEYLDYCKKFVLHYNDIQELNQSNNATRNKGED